MLKSLNKKVIVRNKRARFDYAISKTSMAGLVLMGHEVKAVRAGLVSLLDSFVRIERDEAWLINGHISLWKFSQIKDYEPRRRRKLLLNKKEIRELQIAQDAKRMSIVPLEILVLGRKLKLKIGIGKGRKKYDKRAKIKEMEMKRQVNEDLSRVKNF